jgi:hypothetical protein
MPDTQQLLIDALSHLAKATAALQQARERELCDRAFDLTNDVLRVYAQEKRQALTGA